MTVTVQFFSFLRQLGAADELRVELPEPATVGDLLAELYRGRPKLAALDKTMLVAVGVEFAGRSDPLRDGDVVSLMPPLQGGATDAADELQITDRPIDGAEAAPGALAGDVGGVAVFWGTVRDREDGRSIQALEYTAYREMAEHQLRRVLEQTRQRWRLQRVRVVHRIGVVRVGEASLLVRVEAAHRAEAFAACQFVIETLKQTLPIWKRGLSG
jgi:molybdopterin synthase catalytic subunit/molybdopterin converting factor small subunit